MPTHNGLMLGLKSDSYLFVFFFYLLQQKPFKNDENDFDFVLKAPFVLKTAWLEIYG